MVARLKLKGIDRKASPGVEPATEFDSTQGNIPGPDLVRIARLIALPSLYGWPSDEPRDVRRQSREE